MSALALALALGLTAPAQLGEPPGEDWADGSKVQLDLRHNERPITMPHDVFDIFADGGLTQLSSSWVAAFLGVGARYGIDDRLEVGLRLLRVTMSEAPGTGIDRPTVFSMYRLLGGSFEAAVRLETEVPTSAGGLQLWLQAPMLARLGPYVRLDLVPTLTTVTGASWAWGAGGTLEVSGQVTDRLRIFGLLDVVGPDLRRAEDLLLRAGGGLAWVFGDPSWEILARVRSPAVALVGARPADPEPGNYLEGTVTLRLFFQGPSEDPHAPLF